MVFSFSEAKTQQGRREATGNLLNTDCSAKRMFCWLGSKCPSGKIPSDADFQAVGKAVGLSVVTQKGHKCGKGEIKISSVRQWYKWGNPGFSDESGKSKTAAYLTIPKVIVEKVSPLLK